MIGATKPVFAIDPGPTQSGWCVLAGRHLMGHGINENDEVVDMLGADTSNDVVIEKIASYGMPVGEDVFETCRQTGRMIQVRPDAVLVPRLDVKMTLCHSPRAKDANIGQAIRDQFALWHQIDPKRLKGTKKEPGPLYGVKSHIWAAIGLALTWQRKIELENAVGGLPF